MGYWFETVELGFVVLDKGVGVMCKRGMEGCVCVWLCARSEGELGKRYGESELIMLCACVHI